MLMRLLPLLGGLLLTRGSRRIAGRHAGKLTLALGAWELWRAYQASKAPTGPSAHPETAARSTARTKGSAKPVSPKPVRRKKRWI